MPDRNKKIRSGQVGDLALPWWVILFCVTAFCALPVWAQTEGTRPDSTLEVVMVTATRRAVLSSELAIAVTQVDEEVILERAPGVIAEVLRGEPGAFFQQTTPGQGIPIIRGLKGSQVLHMVDGMRVNNAFFRSAPNQYLALVDAYSLANVELIRGAAGSLYGADAMGGVVLLNTPEPYFSDKAWQWEGRVFARFNSVDEGLTFRAQGAAGRDGTGLSGGITVQDIGDRRTGDGKTVRPTAYKARAGDLKLSWESGDASDWMLSAQVLEQPSTPRIDELVPGFGQHEPASEQYQFQPNRRSFLHGRYRLMPESSSIESVIVHLARQVITDDRVTQDFGSPLINHETNESTLDGLTLQVDQTLSSEWSIVWGMEIYRDEVRSQRERTDQDSDLIVPVRPRFPDGSTMDSDAAYLTATWDNAERWRLEGGLRFSRFDISLPAVDTEPPVDLRPNDLTGDLRAYFRLTDQVALVANLGKGFRPPNIFDLGTLGPRPGNRFNIANAALSPETVWSYDLGFKFDASRIQAELFAFYLDYRDKITSVPTGDITPDGRVVVRSENRNEVTLYGLEGRISWAPTDALRLKATLNATRGQEDNADGTTINADRIPPLNGRLSVDWSVSEGWQLSAWLDAAARQDRLSPRDVADPRINPEGTAGWSTLNLGARWQVNELIATGLHLENLSDESYREHGSGLDAAGRNIGLWLDLQY